MHSRIFQLGLYPIGEDERIDSTDFNEDSFVGSVADYVSDNCDRGEDIGWLVKHLAVHSHVLYNHEEKYLVFTEGFKEAYFKEAYNRVKDAMHTMTLETFATGGVELSKIQCAIENKLGFYVYFDHPQTLDSFVRELECNTKYYIGGTVDYHC